jgi:lysophospholipase L1-like esterase
MIHIPRSIAPLMLLTLLAFDGRAAEPAHDSSRWEKDIQAFEAADRENPPPTNAVLFIGSSSIRMWKTLAEDFPDHQVINRGFGGSQIADSLAFADRILLPYKPRQIVLYAGDNDINAGKTPEQALADFKQFVARVHDELPKTRIAFIAIKPSTARWHLRDAMQQANELIADYCATDKRLDYIAIWTPMLGKDGKPRPDLLIEDGLHLNDAGYHVWTKAVRPFLGPGSPALP